MAKEERNVLELKEMYLSRVLKWKTEFADALVNRGLVKVDQLKNITGERSSDGKTKRLLRHLVTRNQKGDLEQLIGALQDSKYLQLASMLNRELLAERGELQIDPVIDKESATIVHKEHGHEKRLSEEERKKLHILLCTRTQCSRDTWEQQMNDAEERLDDEEKRSEQLDLFAEYLTAQVESFLNVNNRRAGQQQLTNETEDGDDMEGGAGPDGDKNHMLRLEENVNSLITMCSRALLGMENITNETLRSFSVLKVNQDDTSMERAIENILHKKRRAAEKRVQSAKSMSTENTTLVVEMKLLEKKAEKAKLQNEELIMTLTKDTEASEKKIDVLEEHLLGLKERVKAVNALREDWKQRCEALEKGARLTHIYKRDGEKEDEFTEPDTTAVDPDEEFFHQEALQYGIVEPDEAAAAATATSTPEPEKVATPKITKKKSVKRGNKKTKSNSKPQYR